MLPCFSSLDKGEQNNGTTSRKDSHYHWGSRWHRSGNKHSFCSRRLNEQALQEAVAAIGSDAVSYAVADVTQPEQVQAYVRTAVERYDGIDVFINNAGIEGEVKPIFALTP